MAGAGYKLFATGDVLTAAQVNTYLMQQTVMVFASSAARTTALSGVLAEGMVSYLQDTNTVEVYNGSAWVATSAVTSVTAGTGITVTNGSGPAASVALTTPVAVANGGTGITSFGTGVATFLGTPTSANLIAVVSDETGSGSLVFGTSPTITPAAGTTTTGATGAGYLGLPQNATTTGAQAIVAADAGKHIYSTATRTITIPSNATLAMPIGTTITFIAGSGATVTIAITTDTMWLAGSGTTGSRTLAAFGMATAVKIASTTWIISGNGLT